MTLRVSVVVPPTAADSRNLLSSLDRQHLPTADFEVLVGDDEQSPDLTARLDDLVAHRTNLVRVPVAPGTDAAETLLARAQGAYVVAVPPERTLTPNALLRLCDRADAAAADVCLGLTGRAGSRPARLPEAPDELVGPAGALRRRSATTVEQVAADLTGADATVEGAAAVTSTLCFVDGPRPEEGVPPESAGSGRATATSVTWTDGVLEVVVRLSGPAAEARASVYSPATGVEWVVSDVVAEDNQLTLRIDPGPVAGRGRLTDGFWWPSVRIGDDDPVLVGAAPKGAHGATLRGRTVVSFAEGGRLGLDVGGHVHQPIRRFDPAATTVVEDSRGSLLTSPLSNLDLPAGERVTGELRLGKMPVVAWVEHQDGSGPVLQAWVSGLAGSSPLLTKFARAPFGPTGTQLVIDGVGTIRVAPLKKKAAATAPAKGAGKAPAAKPAPPSGPVAKARRLAGRAKRALRS